MHKVRIEPGICGLITEVKAEMIDPDEYIIHVEINSACKAVNKINKDVGYEFNAFDVCLVRPGLDPITKYASENFPGHASCPTISGIIKCIEAEAGLALTKDVQIKFIKD